MADLTTEQIDGLWHRMGSFYPNDHREFARAVLAEAARQAEQERVGRESTDFGEWWDANQQDPLHTMIVRNAAAAAWQERARRTHGVTAAPAAAGPVVGPSSADWQAVAEVVSWTNSSYGRNYKLRWLRNAPEGATLYVKANGGVGEVPRG